MTLILSEDDVHQLLTMPDAIDTLDGALRAWGEGLAYNMSRQRIVVREKGGALHMLGGALPTMDALGFKAYTAFPDGVRFTINLYSATTGALQAIIAADWLGRMRTGAASGLASRYLARADSRTLGVIGTGGQAVTQVMAIAAVYPLVSINVYGRDAERRSNFCTDLSTRIGINVDAVESAAAAVRDADIVVTATTAHSPVLQGAWLKPGTHINAMGSNWHNRREIDDETIARATLIVADSVEQARIEAGDLILPADAGLLDWHRVQELRALVAGTIAGRQQPEDITLFKSLGIGLEDVAIAARVYHLAQAQGIGRELRLLES